MRVVVLSSGGKDSSYATWWALLRGWDVAGIITIRITGDDSMMFQVPTTSLAGIQAASSGIPWLPVAISGNQDTEIDDLEYAISGVIAGSNKNRSSTWSRIELEDAHWPESWEWPDDLRRLRPDLPIDAIVVGALRSDYQKTKIERMCQHLGIRSYTPLWHHSPENHMSDLIEQGFEIMITSVNADGLGEEWLGQILNDSNIQKLKLLAEKYRFNIDGEGGEYETAVISAPWMNHRITTRHTVHWTGARGWVDIWSAELLDIG